MHRIAAQPGGWTADKEGVIFVEQTPAPIALLTAADTDIQTLAAVYPRLPEGFPAIRPVNLLQLQQPLSIDDYCDRVLAQAQVIILRLLGGRSYWSYGLEAIKETIAATGATLWVMPGDDRPDPPLMSHSTVPLSAVNQLWRYLTEGGPENWLNGLKFVADYQWQTDYRPIAPKMITKVGYYPWQEGEHIQVNRQYSGKAAILFYRSHYLAGNTLPIEAICQSLCDRDLEPIPLYVSSLRDPEVIEELLKTLQQNIQIILNTTSFSIADLNAESTTDPPQLWQRLQVPVLQVILSSGTQEQWESSFQGLAPRDVAMNVALPEVDGRIITRAISFKSVSTWHPDLETDVVIYRPVRDRIEFVTQLAAHYVQLSQTPVPQRKIALILANYPNRDGRIANGVGLDTPASCIAILQALAQAGYGLENIPATGEDLIQRLTAGITNDPEGDGIRVSFQSLDRALFEQYFEQLPPTAQDAIRDRWSAFPLPEAIPIPGIQLGNVFVGIQPSRGYDRDPSLNYHAPDLEPTLEYLAYYCWLRAEFKAQAIVHVGKHGNLEWLPGKSLALSEACFPEIALAALPHFYPFIVNDPGEGSQAKRRAQAVILDHLTPPMTRAELYGDLEKLETLIDEYYEAQSLDPSRLGLIGDRIAQLVKVTQLQVDLGFDELTRSNLSHFLTLADGYLCELKEAQIRDGLHIFGQCPQGRQLRDLMLAIARFPNSLQLGLTRAIAADLHLDFDPLTVNWGDRFILPLPNSMLPKSLYQALQLAHTEGDAVTAIEDYAGELIDTLLNTQLNTQPLPSVGVATHNSLNWICTTLLPNLKQTSQEIEHLLQGLAGRYVPSGASGAPTRGRPEVLPTGRNFYSVDIRAIPTETAWDVGRKAAEVVIERYCQDHGDYPKTLAISIWGTSTMRTGGDDVAQVLALLGVQPRWEGSSRRAIGYEIIPVSVLGRPRVDVTVRVSGFFRDSFPNLLQLMADATRDVAQLAEDATLNPLAAQVQAETASWIEQGLDRDRAQERASYRIFGSKPGAYGAGLQGLIESQNWNSDADLAQAYINWSAYAYDRQGQGHSMPEAFEQRLQQMQVVLHNQDNREHDLLDSDDYYQFQGGLTAAVRVLAGKNPEIYFGDHALPSHPKVRRLQEELAKVYRSRVVNPKWIEGVMRHGYKGAFEMAATLDYLFAYDATTHCVEDFMYQGIADAYLFDESVQAFVQKNNPWALRDMAERLLEAHQRGLWATSDRVTLDRLRDLVHSAEGAIETR